MTNLQLFSCMVLLLSLKIIAGNSLLKVRNIIDMAGRTVTIPAIINSVYSTSPTGEILMYTLSPHKIAGRTWTLSGKDKRLLVDDYLEKPVLGGWYGKNTTGNPEVIIKTHPDIVLTMGHLDNTDISASKRIGEQLGIPVVMLNGKITMLDSSYRFLDKILCDTARADTLANFCRNILEKIRSITAQIPADQRIRVYYAEGLQGLETDPKGSMHTEVIEIAGGINVADVPLLQGYGRATVSFEQLLVWKPQFIIVCPDHGHANGTQHYTNILSNPSWQALDAIKKGNVYEIPSIPFNCFDRPPSVNRILGCIWLSNLLYPDYFPIDIKAEVRKFYALFYHKNITDEELDKVMGHAIRSKAPRSVKKGK